MIEESVIKTVMERTDIVRLVSEYVQLRMKSGRYWGCCPFHQEKTPSFQVNPARGCYYCFGCHEGGNASTFLMKMEGLSFPESIERLAERLGIEIVHTDSKFEHKGNAEKARRQSFYDVNRAAMAFFENELASSSGARCRAYMAQRNIPDDVCQNFYLGYAPASWDALVSNLRQNHLSLEDARTIGLIKSREDGGYYALYRDRFMFPVMSAKGDIIAFSGRTLDPQEPRKYYNSPESPIYTKGDHLFGLYQAKTHIAREKCAILVEGNVDTVMMHRYGFCHTVASLGTALTPKQADLIYRHTRCVYLMYDGDEAGQKAMMRAMPILLDKAFEGVYVVQLPAQDDPDSYLKVYGADGMQALLNRAQPIGIWAVTRACDQILSVPSELRKKNYGELSDIIHGFSNETTRRHYLEKAANILGINDERALAVELGMNLEKNVVVPSEINRASAPFSEKNIDPARISNIKLPSVEMHLMQMLFMSEKRLQRFRENDFTELIQDFRLRTLLEAYISLEDRSPYGIEHGLDEHMLPLYHQIVCMDLNIPNDESEREKWYNGTLACLLLEWVKQQIQQNNAEIEACVKNNDQERLLALLERGKELIALQRDTDQRRKKCISLTE